ncbi:MAG: MFS transporter [Acidimicrobiales bacterium]
MQTTDANVPLWEQPHVYERRWKLLGVMCLSLVMVVMSVSGLNVALPTIQEELAASATDLQWIVDAYAIIFAGLLLAAGALGDKYGRKKALMAGLVVFAIGSAVAGLADAPAQIIAGRAISGIGAAFVMPATLSLITTVFPPDERTKAIAFWAAFAGAGGALGPVVSGLLLHAGFWWGSTILVNVPIVVATLAAVAVLSPTSKDDDDTPLDPLGAVLSLIAMAGILYGIIEGQHGWTAGGVLAAFAIGGLAMVGFIAWELRAEHPMLPMEFFKVPSFSISSAVITAAFFMMFGFFFLATQYLQFVKGYSPLRAGFSTMPLGIALIIVSPRSAALAQKIGAAKVIATGFACIAVGFGLLSLVTPTTPYWRLVISFVLLGAGMGSTAAVSTGRLMSSVPQSKAGVGSAVNDTTREVGGAFGIAVLGSILNSAYRGGIDLSGLGLPGPALAAADESMGGALYASRQLPEALGQTVRSSAAVAFTDAFSTVALVVSVVAVVAAIATAVVISRTES